VERAPSPRDGGPAGEQPAGRPNGEQGEAGPQERAAQPAPEALAEIEGRLLRALADLENLRKRYERELARETAAERARVAVQWLPVVDNLERALEHAKADPSALIEGVRAVWEQAVGVLRRLGFPRFDDVGEQFDPSRHQAVSAVEKDDAPGGTVVGSAWPGYGTGDTLLRPAGVVVAKGSG
jgi:molecular chaperone GrpE